MSNPTPEIAEDLAACPFCGNDGSGPPEDALNISHTEHDWRDASWTVQCDKCTATMGYSDSPEEAIAAWNTRAPTPPKVAGDAEGLLGRLDAVVAEEGWGYPDVAEAAAHLRATASLAVEIEALRTLATKVSGIRDSIVGVQGFNWSEHAYPLVAALDEAGYPGAGYEIARKNVGTLIEQTKEAEAARLAAEHKLEPAVEAHKLIASFKPKDGPSIHMAELDARKEWNRAGEYAAGISRTFLAAMNTGADDAE